MRARGLKSAKTHVVLQWTLSALQTHPWALIVADEDATAELKVKTVKYFKSIERVQEEVEAMHARLKDDPAEPEQVGSME